MTNDEQQAEPVELSPEEEIAVVTAEHDAESSADTESFSSEDASVPVIVTGDVEELLRKLDVVKRDVQELKSKVAAASKKKETAFRKKQDLSKSVADKIGDIVGSKKERNTITVSVRELKKERDRLNQEIRQKVAEIKVLTDQHKDALAKFDRRTGPDALARQIEELEFKMETQPMGFEAEQKLTKKIKELKKQYAGMKIEAGAFVEIREKSREIDRLKRDANKFHRQVQEQAQQSQQKHEVLVTESKEIDDIKKQEETLYQEFLAEKKIYTDLSAQLKDKVGELQAIKDALNRQNVRLKEDQKKEEMKTLKERAKEAEQKVKDRKKLTTEDLLALQGLK